MSFFFSVLREARPWSEFYAGCSWALKMTGKSLTPSVPSWFHCCHPFQCLVSTGWSLYPRQYWSQVPLIPHEESWEPLGQGDTLGLCSKVQPLTPFLWTVIIFGLQVLRGGGTRHLDQEAPFSIFPAPSSSICLALPLPSAFPMSHSPAAASPVPPWRPQSQGRFSASAHPCPTCCWHPLHLPLAGTWQVGLIIPWGESAMEICVMAHCPQLDSVGEVVD